ncbi:MAG: TolC family protein, partial [Flavobacteriales bacterium]|nr:TolC family protein [Flavobacteriales bacterium]
MNRIALILLTLWLSVGGPAQELLTFELALQNALEHNHEIRMARLDAEMAENDARAGSNGYLPT